MNFDKLDNLLKKKKNNERIKKEEIIEMFENLEFLRVSFDEKIWMELSKEKDLFRLSYPMEFIDPVKLISKTLHKVSEILNNNNNDNYIQTYKLIKVGRQIERENIRKELKKVLKFEKERKILVDDFRWNKDHQKGYIEALKSLLDNSTFLND